MVTIFLKNPKPSLSPNFNACHQLQCQNSIMKRFREKFKNVGPKWTIYPIFAIIRIFLKNKKKSTLNHALLPVIRYNFRKTQQTHLRKSLSVDFGPKNDPLTPIRA